MIKKVYAYVMFPGVLAAWSLDSRWLTQVVQRFDEDSGRKCWKMFENAQARMYQTNVLFTAFVCRKRCPNAVKKFCLVLSVLSMVSRFKLKVFSFFLYFLTNFFCFAKYNESRKGKELERCLSWTRVQKCRSAMPLFVLFYRTARHASELGG